MVNEDNGGENTKEIQINIDDLMKPIAIVEVQEDNKADDKKDKEQSNFPQVILFFSFDIVNSTMYKSLTGKFFEALEGQTLQKNDIKMLKV